MSCDLDTTSGFRISYSLSISYASARLRQERQIVALAPEAHRISWLVSRWHVLQYFNVTGRTLFEWIGCSEALIPSLREPILRHTAAWGKYGAD